VKFTATEDIYCTCRTINEVKRPMIYCDICRKCYHMDCEGLDPTNESIKKQKWSCSVCNKDQPSLD